MEAIRKEWLDAIGDEFKMPYYKDLYAFIRNEYRNHVIYPEWEDIFNAFHLTPLNKVKVVIIRIGRAHV